MTRLRDSYGEVVPVGVANTLRVSALLVSSKAVGTSKNKRDDGVVFFSPAAQLGNSDVPSVGEQPSGERDIYAKVAENNFK